MTRYYEDMAVGEEHELGSYTAEHDELLGFAERYDPQAIHTDPEAAADTIYDGLIASGWHTASACMALAVEGFLGETAALGAFGLDELRWRTPVRPGDTVSARLRVAEKTESTSRSDRGYVEVELEASNDDGEEVLYWRATNVFARA